MTPQTKEIIERLIVHTSRDDILKGYYSAEIESDMAKARALLDSSGWIKCSERLPDRDGKRVIAGNKHGVTCLHKHEDGWVGNEGHTYTFSEFPYWQPLPEPPKEEAK